MLIRLTEVHRNTSLTTKNEYMLREVFVNPEHVVMIREDARMQTLNEQSQLPSSLMKDHRFTKLTINRGQTGTEIVVVGAPDMVERSLNQKAQLLRG
ncbi:MAG TPA: hypothetical protein DCX27_22460 [Balneola sp.]|nr:hypothetical protein [Balneola sp.]